MAHHEVTPEEIAMLEEMVKKAKAAAEVIATSGTFIYSLLNANPLIVPKVG